MYTYIYIHMLGGSWDLVTTYDWAYSLICRHLSGTPCSSLWHVHMYAYMYIYVYIDTKAMI